jgi:hypothetical protein
MDWTACAVHYCICSLVKKELSSFETPLWLHTNQSAYGFRDIL